MGNVHGGEAEIVREGEYWTIRVANRELRVRDSKGLRYLAELLAHPQREIDAIALSGARDPSPLSAAAAAEAGLTSSADARADRVLDDRARREYRARLDDLRAEIEEAEAFHDPERAARAREEHAAIADELAAATGLGGRDRRTGSADERARLNVTRAIRSAIARINEHDHTLGQHLTACVHTGRVCVFRPDPDAPSWSVSTTQTKRSRPRRIPSPETRYARKGDVSIAYQVVGDGPIDIVFVNGLIAHLDLIWANPTSSAVLRTLASFSRLILFDKPGTGLSDPVAGAPSLEQRTDDITAVMDAVGSRRAAILGYSEGGMVSAAFAAMHPQRTTALVLLNSTARSARGADFAPAFDQLWWLLDLAVGHWGEGEFFCALAPSWGRGELERRTAAIGERACASPGMVRAMIAALGEYDVRPLLPLIRAPTLTIHARDEPLLAIELGRDLAAQIPGARFVEVPGVDHLYIAGDWDQVAIEIGDFLRSDFDEPSGASRTTVLHAQAADPRAADATITALGGRTVAQEDVVAEFASPSGAVRCARTLLDIGLIPSAGIDIEANNAATLATHAENGAVLISAPVRALLAGSGIQARPHRAAYLIEADARSDARSVSSVDAATAARTPGPRDTMTALDHATVAAARRAPGLSRMTVHLRRATRRTDRP